jgi:hypothetical protein
METQKSLERYLPPWGVELDEQILMLLELIVKGVIGENEDTLFSLDSRDGLHNVGGCEQEK